MKKSKVAMLAATAMTGLLITACGNSEDSTGGSDSSFNIGMVTDLGSVNDKSFNQSAWEGLEKLSEDEGYEVSYLEPQSDGEVEPSILQYVNSDTDLTWATAATLEDAVVSIAEDNPDANLGIVDSGLTDIDNVVSVSFKEQEGAFLAGVVAGETTESNTVGFIGGMEIPVIQRFHAGFEAGVKEVNPDAEVLVNYVGVFNRVDMGKSAAATMYNQDADVIFHAAGGTGNGIFNEAQERYDSGEQVWVIGVDKDQSLEFGNDITLTSMMKNVDQAVYNVSQDAAEGNFPGGENVSFGLSDDGVGLAETSDINVSEEVLEKVEMYKEQIINGEIDIPVTP